MSVRMYCIHVDLKYSTPYNNSGFENYGFEIEPQTITACKRLSANWISVCFGLVLKRSRLSPHFASSSRETVVKIQ